MDSASVKGLGVLLMGPGAFLGGFEFGLWLAHNHAWAAALLTVGFVLILATALYERVGR